MKSLSVSANPRLRFLVDILRNDGTAINLVTGQLPVTIGGTTWLPGKDGLQLGDFTETNDGKAPSTSISAFMTDGGPFDPADVCNDLFRNADYYCYLVDLNATPSPDHRTLWFAGRFTGSYNFDLGRNVTFDIVNRFARPRDVFVRQYGIPCDADFGDPRRCKIPTWPDREVGSSDLHDVQRSETIAVGDRRRFRFASAGAPDDYLNVYLECTAITTGITSGSAPSISSTLDATSTDGGVTWTTRNAYVRYVRVAAINSVRNITLNAIGDSRATDPTWYNPGRIKIGSGYLLNLVAKVNGWNPDAIQIDVIDPICELLAVNDWIEIAPDCDKTLDMCVNKYANANNYRGFPHLTGDKVVTSTITGASVIPGITDDPGAGATYTGNAVEFADGSS